MTRYVNRDKASSHPTKPGGIYVGVVKSVTPDGKVFVQIPYLGNTIGPIRVLNGNTNSPLTVDTQVLCAYTNLNTAEMYVLGYVNNVNVLSGETEIRNMRVSLLMDVD